MSETVVVACNIRNGLIVNGVICRGYFQFPGEPPPENSFLGYALTMNVPKKNWDDWFSINQENEYVTQGLIMAAETVEAVKGAIARHRGSKVPRMHTFGSRLYTGR